ncbi:Putative flippase GtrA (transmembrane translocase of bactoprenol-linked glucose) [Halobacillus alkaliphilus]|uniref:Putative flippase GtrA (Transmembrane translocase of bactoprenol-linked glucose) n=1 Tax=Halobacillus alkaliphilus TaxID=396056 RepID=A0A1I2PTG4_9BACI|nr:GtrA family protein [Halobacillus alkaliphilus]SFG16896.1 Putative flippase GtrA (transmembrane translocase of bactoprenol-linked glucose) [Halobacillus alkaliphilus]
MTLKINSLNNELTRFILVGGMNTLNYYIVFLFLHNLLNFHYMVAHITGFLISFVISFFLNTYFTYKVKPTLKKFLQFPLTQVVNVGVSSLLVFVLVDLLSLNSNIAPLIAVFFTVPVTFIVTSKILKQ